MKSGVMPDGTYRVCMRKMTKEDIRIGVDFWFNQLGRDPLHGTIVDVIEERDVVRFSKEGNDNDVFETQTGFLLNFCQIML